ncbi:MAG: hypothetical protein A4E35_00229 [Methanoregula sp. PtaU1.Bin051]|nr:MAG: hypothetical protein A4E35_00229 [Methanoregula sp. PtaU1.Bin051]
MRDMSDEWVTKVTPARITVALITGLMLGFLLQVVLLIFNQWLLAPLMFLLVGGGGIVVFVFWMQRQPDLIPQ